MKNLSPELKVGVFAIIVVLILSYMTFKVGGMPFTWNKGYRLYATFNDIKGLDDKSRIKISGVDSGTVEKIRLKDGKAELTQRIRVGTALVTQTRCPGRHGQSRGRG